MNSRQTPSRSLHLLYHELRPVKSDYSYVVQCGEFAAHMDLVSNLQLSGSAVRPEVTFDDGHLSNFEYALPLLQSRSLLARFFITVGWTGQRAGYMGWSELRALQESGHLIGAHGWTHTLLTRCTNQQLETELIAAKETLEDKLASPITMLSLPGGRFNRRVIDACTAAGYSQIFTSIPRSQPRPGGLMTGRVNICGDIQTSWISDLLQPESKVLMTLQRKYRLKAAAKLLLGDDLYAKLWGKLNRQEPDTAQSDVSA